MEVIYIQAERRAEREINKNATRQTEECHHLGTRQARNRAQLTRAQMDQPGSLSTGAAPRGSHRSAPQHRAARPGGEGDDDCTARTRHSPEPRSQAPASLLCTASDTSWSPPFPSVEWAQRVSVCTLTTHTLVQNIPTLSTTTRSETLSCGMQYSAFIPRLMRFLLLIDSPQPYTQC